jgi:hypothetical protein
MPSTFGMCRIAAAAVLRARGRNGSSADDADVGARTSVRNFYTMGCVVFLSVWFGLAAAPDGLPGPSPCRRGANGQKQSSERFRHRAELSHKGDTQNGALRLGVVRFVLANSYLCAMLLAPLFEDQPPVCLQCGADMHIVRRYRGRPGGAHSYPYRRARARVFVRPAGAVVASRAARLSGRR